MCRFSQNSAIFQSIFHKIRKFIPKRPLLNDTAWSELNNILNNEGKEIKIDLKRIHPNISYDNSNKITLICRLIKGGRLEPYNSGDTSDRGKPNLEICRGSEWNRLMYRICDQISSEVSSGIEAQYSGGKQLGENWFNYTGTTLGFGSSNDLGRITWCKEYIFVNNNTKGVIARGSEAGVGLLTGSGVGYVENRGFRPVLILKVSNQ